MVKKLTVFLVILSLAAALIPVGAFADGGVDAVLPQTGAYVLERVPNPSIGVTFGDWAAVGLARSGMSVPDAWYRAYYTAAARYVDERGGVLDANAYTEYSRVILGFTAAGFDPRDVAGYDLTLPLGDFEQTVWQGINGAVFALIALDSGNYQIPANPAASTQATRELYIDAVLSEQLANGGFPLDTNAPNPDMTAMAMQALSNYTDRDDVAEAVDAALEWLSSVQGSFVSSESVSQTILALCALGISVEDARFVNDDGETLLERLLTFRNGDGSFSHTTDSSQMATEQALCALAAVKRAEAGQNKLYDMTDAPVRGPAARVSVTTEISYQQDGTGFVIPRRAFTFDSSLSEEYGYYDVFAGERASALDAIVAAHIAVFGEDKDVIHSKLTVGDGGYLKPFMGDDEGNMLYYVDGEMPLVSAPEHEINGGGIIEIFALHETYPESDIYGRFEQNGTKTESVSAAAGAELTLTLRGSTWEDDAAVAGASVKAINAETGEFGRVLGVTDAEGNVTLTFSSSGNYIVGAVGAEDAAALMSPWLRVTVTGGVSSSGGGGGGGGSDSSVITVYFTLMGDDLHEDGAAHGYKNGGLQTWAAKKGYSVAADATAADVIKKALDEAGITWQNPTGNYIESLTRNGVTLGQFSNGPKSGWMYLVNGVASLKGIAEQSVKSGDEILLFYTDDYTEEDGGGLFADGNGAEKDPEADGAAAVLFDDVTDGDWFYEAVRYVKEHGLMSGTANGVFDPYASLTRGMLVTVLYRAEGEPEHGGGAAFTDVPDGAWYADSVAWASENGLVNGYGGGLFGAEDDITREQLVVILYNYARRNGGDVSASADLSAFSDAGEVSEWAATAVRWAVASSLIQGRGEDTLAPSGTAERAEAAALLMRFIGGMDSTEDGADAE
ncbi:MAG: S-layer homology domain-containing protein [Clostridiales bacterium]|jgi:hypothetical protein|nr:S-layer homology domain-containing protein [Clostridiales bacterium]